MSPVGESCFQSVSHVFQVGLSAMSFSLLIMPFICQAYLNLSIMPSLCQSCLYAINHVFRLSVMSLVFQSWLALVCQSCLQSINHVFSPTIMSLICQSCLKSGNHIFDHSIMSPGSLSVMSLIWSAIITSFSPLRNHAINFSVISSICQSCYLCVNYVCHV